MNCNLNNKIIKEIQSIAEKYQINKITLFGSRARRNNKCTSDIDLAIYTSPDFNSEGSFASEIQDISTLLKIDIVFIDSSTSKKLISNIIKEGVIIYERL